MLSARFAIWNGEDHISAPLYTSPNSILHIKRSSVPSRGPDISTMSRIDSAGTSLMNSMPWHMPMIGRRLVPRISIPVRILHPSVFSCMITRIHMYVRAWVRCVADANDLVKHFDFIWLGLASLASTLFAHYFCEWSSYNRLSENRG